MSPFGRCVLVTVFNELKLCPRSRGIGAIIKNLTYMLL
jgi:hypothetical protein